jgi:hypothetical protein
MLTSHQPSAVDRRYVTSGGGREDKLKEAVLDGPTVGFGMVKERGFCIVFFDIIASSKEFRSMAIGHGVLTSEKARSSAFCPISGPEAKREYGSPKKTYEMSDDLPERRLSDEIMISFFLVA